MSDELAAWERLVQCWFAKWTRWRHNEVAAVGKWNQWRPKCPRVKMLCLVEFFFVFFCFILSSIFFNCIYYVFYCILLYMLDIYLFDVFLYCSFHRFLYLMPQIFQICINKRWAYIQHQAIFHTRTPAPSFNNWRLLFVWGMRWERGRSDRRTTAAECPRHLGEV